jgi:hypothetical protein
MDNTEGFEPIIYTGLGFNNDSKTFVPGIPREMATFVKESTNHPKSREAEVPKLGNPKETESISYNIVNIGEIGNIYVSIGKIIQTYRDLAGGENGVNIIDFLQQVLDDISYSLGGINDFKLYTERNKIQIIDTKYLEGTNDPEGSSSQKFQLDLIGLKSICRDVQITSKIFSEQSTMIGIGAASPGGDANNLGDIYSSTQNLLNKGLKDRLIRDLEYSSNTGNEKVTIGNTDINDENLYYIDVYNNIISLTNYLKRKVVGSSNAATLGYYSIYSPEESEVQNAASLLKSLHYQLNGKDVDFKALIPFELEITLDGISGLVVGQIFVIDKSILPKDYYNKNLGFVITGVNHSLQNNDWTTNIKTQICLLDNESIEDRASVNKDKLKKIIQSARVNQAQNGYLYCALADYMVSQYVFAVTKGGSIKPSYGLVNELGSDPKKIYTIEYSINNLFGDTDNIPDIKPKIQTITSYLIEDFFVEKYLENWYNAAKPLNAPNFPADFASFKTPANGVGTSDWNTVLKNITELLRKKQPFDSFSISKVTKDDYWSKTASQPKLDFYEDVKKTSKQAWEATFFGQIQKGNENLIFPLATSTTSTNNKIKHIPFDKAGGIENQIFDLQTITSYTGGSTGGAYTSTTTTKYGITNDSFDKLFLLFYNFIDTNKASLGLSAYGAPAVNNVTTQNTNFRVIHIEGTTN